MLKAEAEIKKLNKAAKLKLIQRRGWSVTQRKAGNTISD